MNKIPFPSEPLQELKMTVAVQKTKGYNLTHLFRTPKIRSRSLTLFFIWLSISTSYYGVTYKMTRFNANRYLIFFIGGAVETIVYILSLPIMRRFGRKKPLLTALLLAAVFCISSGIVNDRLSGFDFLTAMLALLGRCCMALLFGIIFVFTSELYPTLIRNIGMGACCFWARVGGVLAPQINQWTKKLAGFDAIIFFGGMLLISSLLLLLLDETANQKMPNSIEDVEEPPKENLELVDAQPLI